jgi:putative membrane protein insertion efficiency factor
MRFFLFIFSIIGLKATVSAQISSSDLLLIKQKNESVIPKKNIRKYTNLSKNKWQAYNPINLTFSGLMFFYQNVLSSQVNAGCIYSPSCSEFSKQCIKKHGLVKGIFLSADRVQRCNRITVLGLNIRNLNSQFKFPDNPEEYSCKH